jgi:hypothetical protein
MGSVAIPSKALLWNQLNSLAGIRIMFPVGRFPGDGIFKGGNGLEVGLAEVLFRTDFTPHIGAVILVKT